MLERLKLIRWPWEIFFGGLCLLAALPLWLVDHPPIQDLPQHLAAIRVLHDFGDPTLGFSDLFEVSLGRTQYLAYYLAADILAYPLGVKAANLLLVTASIVGLPYAMRSLLSELGRDQRLALFALPLTWNAHLILGFLNFIAAIPLALLGLALAIRLRRQLTRNTAVAFVVVSVLTFYTHVVPFGFLGLGATLVFLSLDLRATLARGLTLVPAGVATLIWSATSPAGQSTLTAALFADGDAGPQPQFQTVNQAIAEVSQWLTDVLHDPLDEALLVTWVLLAMLAFAFGTGQGRVNAEPRDRVARSSLARIGLLAPVAALAYFVTPSGYDWIWPINARFPLLTLLFLIPILPAPRRLPGIAVFGGVALVAALGFVKVADAFVAFEEEEVGELDEAIAAIPPGQKVAGLMWDRGSRHVRFNPFIHGVAWYQAERGGAVMFTFADFPQSPFRFREDNRPPRVPPRWEWLPERVDPARDLSWYDYVLVRGGPGPIQGERELYEPIFRSPRWSVWERRR